ncbi:unnamed protein product [Oikopleura dioica]|uniref:Uncharacterized protein n=1 Tax=Oikopleura dioica TaxID=34765 RepID=E4X0W7_OIKDI|nr:unnamed protein product [Oikopleura dioica]
MSYDARIKQEALEKIEKTNDVEENDEKEMMSKIQMTRAMLVLALAEKSQKYFRTLRMYFVGRFDLNKLNNEVSSILDEKSLALHQTFLALLNGDKDVKASKLNNANSKDFALVRGCKMARKSTINEPQVSKAWEPPAGNTLAQAILVGSFAEGLEGVDVKALKAIESGLQIYMTRLLSDDLNDGITRDPRLPNIELYATTLPEI